MTWTDLGPSADMGTFLRTISVVTPTGTSADAANIQAALTAMAGVGEVRLKPGTFAVNTVITVPSRSVLVCHPSTVIDSTIADSGIGAGGYANSVFYATPASDGSATTLAATAVIGAYTISTNASIAVGKTIIWGSVTNNTLQSATVLAVSGSGPYTLTLDEPNLWAHASGLDVAPKTQPTGIMFYGNGAKVIGSGDRAFEMVSALRCYIADFYLGPSGTRCFAAFAASFDTGGRDSTYERIVVDGGARVSGISTPTPIGLAIESSARCVLRSCRVRDGGSSGSDSGFLLNSARNFDVQDCYSDRWYIGCYAANSGGTDNDGAAFGTVQGGAFRGGANGIYIAGKCDGLRILNVAVQKNTATGIYVLASGGDADNVQIAGVTCESNGTSDTASTSVECGIVVKGGNVRISNTTIRGSAYFGIRVDGTAVVQVGGLNCKDNNSGDVRIQDTANVTVSGYETTLTSAHTAYWIGVMPLGTGRVEVECATFRLSHPSGTKQAISTQGGSCTLITRSIRALNLGSGAILAGVYVGGSSDSTKWYRYAMHDLSACTNPWLVQGTAAANFGTFTLNGTTQVDVSSACIGVDSRIALSLKTVGGTPGTGAPYFSAAIAAGHFYVKSPTVSANDVYNWAALLEP